MIAKVESYVGGNVYLREGRVKSTWYVRWRDGNGEHRKALGPHWSQKGKAPGWMLQKARGGAGPARAAGQGPRRAGKPSAHGRHLHRRCRGVAAPRRAGARPEANHVIDYRSALRAHLLPSFGAMQIEQIAARTIESRRAQWLTGGMSRRSANKQLAIMHGIFERAHKVYGLAGNPVAEIERLGEGYDAALFDFYNLEEIAALVRHAADGQDAAIYLTAAFTGLRRGELVALRWRDVDFPGSAIRVWSSYSKGTLTKPKSGKPRVVPMVPDVAAALARLGQRRAAHRRGRPRVRGIVG